MILRQRSLTIPSLGPKVTFWSQKMFMRFIWYAKNTIFEVVVLKLACLQTYLHMIAIGMVKLPDGLEQLELKTRLDWNPKKQSRYPQLTDKNSDSEESGKRYTLETALSIFDTLSSLYPQMTCVLVVNEKMAVGYGIQYHYHALAWRRNKLGI